MQNFSCRYMGFEAFKVAVMSMKLKIRLYTHSCMNTRSGTKVILRSSDWLMRSELGYFAHSLVSDWNNSAATLIPSSHTLPSLPFPSPPPPPKKEIKWKKTTYWLIFTRLFWLCQLVKCYTCLIHSQLPILRHQLYHVDVFHKSKLNFFALWVFWIIYCTYLLH